jgi:hypothetical protein
MSQPKDSIHAAALIIGGVLNFGEAEGLPHPEMNAEEAPVASGAPPAMAPAWRSQFASR